MATVSSLSLEHRMPSPALRMPNIQGSETSE